MTIITSVVAHIDHGKTTLLDSLLAYTKTISPISAGELRYLDSRGDEQTRGITLKLSALNIPDVQMTFLDTPGHIDLHHNIMESNSLVDTSILLVDVNEGITPRIFSLISNKPTILFLNKIDKLFDLSLEDVVFRLEQILCKIQAMFDDKFINHDNYFEWNKNNIIIGSTKYTFAVNYTSFSVFKKNSTIKSLIYFVFKIKEAIDSNSCIKIFNEYKIKNINTKEVFTSLFPLHKTLFQSNKCIYKEKHSNFTQALTSYSVCHNDKVLFITRIFGGKISKDDFMLCFNHRDVSIEKVKGVYIFKNERLEEVSEVSGDNLVALEGNFFKKCNFFNLMELIKLHNNYAMTDKIEYFIDENAQEINGLPIKLLENKIKALKSIDLNDSVVNFIAKFMLYNYKRACEERTPFYSKILLMNNLNELNLFKDLFRKIYQTESCIKVILNKYNEFEINTQGRVHLEKVLYDFDALYSKSEVVSDIKLINFGTGYTLIDKEGSFAECSTIYSKFENEDVFLEVIPSENEECLCVSNNELSESILINFINNGLLIKEKIKFTKFILNSNINCYSKIRNYLCAAYEKSQPIIISQHIRLLCDTPDDQMHTLYSLGNTYDGVIQLIEYNTYYRVEIILPTIHYNNFVENVGISCKGTVFIQPKDWLFLKREGIFKKYESELRIKKGIEMLSIEE